MKDDLSTVDWILIRHAVGVYACARGFRRDPDLKHSMADLLHKLRLIDDREGGDGLLDARGGVR